MSRTTFRKTEAMLNQLISLAYKKAVIYVLEYDQTIIHAKEPSKNIADRFIASCSQVAGVAYCYSQR